MFTDTSPGNHGANEAAGLRARREGPQRFLLLSE
jgi:hypothetical protein